jgi:hypothetical protein
MAEKGAVPPDQRREKAVLLCLDCSTETIRPSVVRLRTYARVMSNATVYTPPEIDQYYRAHRTAHHVQCLRLANVRFQLGIGRLQLSPRPPSPSANSPICITSLLRSPTTAARRLVALSRRRGENSVVVLSPGEIKSSFGKIGNCSCRTPRRDRTPALVRACVCACVRARVDR